LRAKPRSRAILWQQADFLAALGEVRLAALEDADGALAAYRDAIDRNPDHAHARAALTALLGIVRRRARARWMYWNRWPRRAATSTS
jgi:tetratricopeptide (TPR) repeat protein